MKGNTFTALSKLDRGGLCEAVLYEIASTFCVPGYHDDPELKESVYMRVMISIRSLTHFFTFDDGGDYRSNDVFAWQFFSDVSVQNLFKGSKNSPDIPPAELSKISKQIAHITSDRPSYSGLDKRWKLELREKLRPSALRFIDCSLRNNVADIGQKIHKGFQRVAREMRYKTSFVQPDSTAVSNTAFVVSTIDRDPSPLERFSIVRHLL